MRPPAPVWETTYRHDRRKHAHRCRCCYITLKTGEPALMAKVKSGTTYAVHLACASRPHGDSGWTWRDAMTAWGLEYLRACGFKIEQKGK